MLPRELDVLTYKEKQLGVGGAGDSEVAARITLDMKVDLSQSISRVPARVDGATSCILPGSKIFDCKRKRFYLGSEKMALQLLTDEVFPAMWHHSDNLLSSLAGNAWNGAPTIALGFCILANMHLLYGTTDRADPSAAQRACSSAPARTPNPRAPAASLPRRNLKRKSSEKSNGHGNAMPGQCLDRCLEFPGGPLPED